MRALVIDPDFLKEVDRVKKYAKEHVYSLADLHAIIAKKKDPPGDDPNFVIATATGVRIVYTQEYQLSGRCHHLSVSVDTIGKYPSVELVQEIMKLFDMGNDVMKASHVGTDKASQSVDVIKLLPN